MFGRGLTITGVTYVDAIAAIHAAGRKFATFLRRYDVILSATLPAPPPKLGYFDMYGDVDVINKRVSEYLSIHAAAVGLLHRLITSCCRHSQPGVRESYA